MFGDEGVGGVQDGGVDFFGGAFFHGDEGVEFGEGEFFPVGALGAEAGVDEVQLVLFIVQAHEGAVGGEVEVESALGARFANAFADSVVGLALDVGGELFEFGFGERSEGWLEAKFFHRSVRIRIEPLRGWRTEKSEKIKYLRRKTASHKDTESQRKRELKAPKREPACGHDGAEVSRAGWDACAPRRVSPRPEGLKRGESESPGFGHAVVLGDTRMLSCVME